jgi:protoporphyrinogen oxidase
VDLTRHAKPELPHVVVIGGGVAGLACARALEAAGDRHVTLIEATDRLGGKVRSDRLNGFVLDGGSDVCIGDKLRRTEAFAALALGDRLVRVNPNELPTYTLRDGKLHPAPVAFTGELVTFENGMQGIVDALVGALRTTRVDLGTRVALLARVASRWHVTLDDGRTIVADAVVIALPARESARLLHPFAPHSADALRTLRYLPTTTVSLGWRRDEVPHPLHGTGYLVDGARDGDVTACTWTSSKTPSHAPDDFVLLRGYIRGVVPDPVALVLEQLRATLGISAPPSFTHVTEWPEGLPEYPASHSETVASLERELASNPGLAIAGAAFHGVGVPDCILSGEAAARAVLSTTSVSAS